VNASSVRYVEESVINKELFDLEDRKMIDFSKKKSKKVKIMLAVICILIVFGMVAGLLFASL
jgi:hypothetical protein